MENSLQTKAIDISTLAVVLKQKTRKNVIIKQPSRTQYGSPMGSSYNSPSQNSSHIVKN